jgi:arylsulfatase A-like enzyme
MSVDDTIGRIFERLSGLGERRDTLAIFTSDNGFTWADHGIGGEGGLGGNKRLPYTASVKVPLWSAGPGMSRGMPSATGLPAPSTLPPPSSKPLAWRPTR